MFLFHFFSPSTHTIKLPQGFKGIHLSLKEKNILQFLRQIFIPRAFSFSAGGMNGRSTYFAWSICLVLTNYSFLGCIYIVNHSLDFKINLLNENTSCTPELTDRYHLYSSSSIHIHIVGQ